MIKNRKILKDLFEDDKCFEVSRVMLHQAMQLPKAGTETTLSDARTAGIKLVYHPVIGIIGNLKESYFIVPSANVIVAYE